MADNENVFNQHAEAYDQWFDENAALFRSELRALEQAVPKNQIGIEIGVGTGRFAAPLEIPYGIEPADNMAKIAEERGITVFPGYSEDIPFPNASFDYAVMVTTVCFLTYIKQAFLEAYRILQPQSTFIIGLIDKTSQLGRAIEDNQNEGTFYENAALHSPEDVTEALKNARFHSFTYWQTLTDVRGEQIESPQQGYGEGGFVVIKAIK